MQAWSRQNCHEGFFLWRNLRKYQVHSSEASGATTDSSIGSHGRCICLLQEWNYWSRQQALRTKDQPHSCIGWLWEWSLRRWCISRRSLQKENITRLQICIWLHLQWRMEKECQVLLQNWRGRRLQWWCLEAPELLWKVMGRPRLLLLESFGRRWYMSDEQRHFLGRASASTTIIWLLLKIDTLLSAMRWSCKLCVLRSFINT